MDIKDINLTERDFDMLIDALDNLPNKGAMGNMLGHLFAAAVTRDERPEEKGAIERKLAEMDARQKREEASIKEDIRILQGKLIMLKRHLIENDLMRQAKESL